MSRPPNSMLPRSMSTSRSSERPVVAFPQHDSPTSASVSPAARSKLICSNAWTRRRTRLKNPNAPRTRRQSTHLQQRVPDDGARKEEGGRRRTEADAASGRGTAPAYRSGFGPRPHGSEQGTGIRMSRRVENLDRRAILDYFSAIHDEHAVSDFCDDPHVVRDEHDRHVHFLLQQADEFQDLCLDRHIERSRGLVGNEQSRSA
jgi:hypothetical protein